MSRTILSRVLCVILGFGCCLNVANAGDKGKTKKGIPAYLQKAVAAAQRPASDRARDAARKPGRIMKFFGIRPGMRVAEMMAGRGYYVELLSRAVGPKGKVYAHNNLFVVRRFAGKALKKRLGKGRLPNVVRLDRELETPGLPKGLDAVLMILFYHDTYWMKADRAKMNRAIFRALKPGGIFGVIDHSAKAGAGAKEVKRLHRIEESWVKRELLAAGFQLVAQSQLLRNPKDDRSINVFRPQMRGQTDRFVLLFRKPLR